MKLISIGLLFILLPFYGFGQEANPRDVESPDAIIAALYDVISGPAGRKRDWDRMKSLFIAEGKLIPTFVNQQGEFGYRYWSIDEYIETAGQRLEEGGFFEKEVSRKTENYGTIMHAFSTYESRHKAEDENPFVRGINSIQLTNDGKRWWIVTVMWMGETEKYPIPEEYLKD